MRTIKVTMAVHVPAIPNFLRTEQGEAIRLCDISEEGLRVIACEWVNGLLAKAKEQGEELKESKG